MAEFALSNLVYTGLWNTSIALFLAGTSMMFDSRGHGFLTYLLPVWLISNLVGYLIHGGLVGLDICCAAGLARPRPPAGGLSRRRDRQLVLLGIAVGNALVNGFHPLYPSRAARC